MQLLSRENISLFFGTFYKFMFCPKTRPVQKNKNQRQQRMTLPASDFPLPDFVACSPGEIQKTDLLVMISAQGKPVRQYHLLTYSWYYLLPSES